MNNEAGSPGTTSTSTVDETTRRMKKAIEEADLDGFVETLSPDVVLRSPISMKAEFRGIDEMRELMEAVFATIADIRYYEELGDDRARALFYRARVGSQPIAEACLIGFDSVGKINEFTLWIRPMAGITRLAAELGPQLARRHSRPKAALVAAAAKPLALLTAKADGSLVKLVKPDRGT